MNIDVAITEELKRISKDKTILDCGGYSGAECNTCMLAGAKSSVCVDDASWRTYDRWAEFAPFPNVEYIDGNFMEYNKPADIVILKNVIYHQRDPWHTLEHMRSLTKETFVLATSYVEGDEPMWRVYRPYEGHPASYTVAWRPTKNGLITLLEATGFADIKILTEHDQGSLALTAKLGVKPRGFGERN